MQAWAAMEIDGDEVIILGIFPDVAQAKARTLENENQYGPTEPDDLERYEENLAEATTDAGSDLDGLRWESGVGSWDYQIAQVEVTL